MKALIINNPSSGRASLQKNLESIVGRLVLEGTLSSVKKFDTSVSFDYEKAVRDGVESGLDVIIALGGDGTINHVVNGMMKAGADVPLAIIPAGTVNDFAGFFNMPSDIDEICRMIRGMKTKAVDVCTLNDKYFINVAACGLFTDIALTTTVESKTILGRLAYYAEGLKEIPKQIFQSFPLKFTVAGESFESEISLFAVSNTTFAGGFKKFAPNATIDDGLFDVVVIEKTDILDFANLFMGVLKGDHVTSNAVKYFKTDRLRVETLGAELRIDMDGEDGGGFPAEFGILHKALKIYVP
ncbi:diacylglycerol kinase DagK [Peptoclostridium acidaminophilum DSM 3953]|uniref:Diacylglycerol kinase DagK n=1 Tax=Peptoclostridium acidaminophilum DSM 3953 TaxID=1286171 RepID=W8T414_PEPAC|nr:diacylglycerol kinase family protein [Peptoclostridium acidaminophilum]AHM55560.1 diacylglycerol kinase DagK [Peptoclostridium acidaminophilum DSM 3953]